MLTCFASDMLIIRHGRSRVRHSSEKDHIRWGLKAFDNLTLDNDYDNDTMLNGNQSFFGNGTDILYPNTSAEKLYLFSTIDYQQQQPSDYMAKQLSTNSKALPTTTAIAVGKKKIAKKQIMASIQKAVDKGLEYLKSHAYLTDENVNIDLPKTEMIGSDLVPPNDDGNTVNRNALSSTANRLPQTPTAVSPKLSANIFAGNGTSNSNVMVIATNNSDNFGNRQFREGNTNDIKNNGTNNLSSGSSKRFQHLETAITSITTAITTSNIKNDLNKQFIVAYNKAQQDKQKLDGNGVRSSKSDEHFNHILLNKTENHIKRQNNHHQQQHHHQKSDNSDNNKNKSPLNEDKIVAHNNPSTAYDDNAEAIMSSSLHSSLSLSPSSVDGASVAAPPMFSSGNTDEQTALSTGPSAVVNDNGVYEEMSDKFVLNENDDVADNSGSDSENVDEIKTNNSDEQSSYVSVIGEDNEGGGGVGNVRIPFVVDDYVDLEGLDETSRNNRLNLIKGQDVVTKFLQIVETQHLLGSNCTAGTALNLGEGVVDRYAQDRFRVEAEIAVNRANMLTR